MTRLSVSLFFILGAAACESPAFTGACPTGYRTPQIVVAVTDSASARPIAALASGEVHDASRLDSLSRAGLPASDSLHLAAYVFRSSVYSVSVQAPGYSVWQRGGIVAPGPGSGTCPTPSNVNLDVRLQPSP